MDWDDALLRARYAIGQPPICRLWHLVVVSLGQDALRLYLGGVAGGLREPCRQRRSAGAPLRSSACLLLDRMRPRHPRSLVSLLGAQFCAVVARQVSSGDRPSRGPQGAVQEPQSTTGARVSQLSAPCRDANGPMATALESDGLDVSALARLFRGSRAAGCPLSPARSLGRSLGSVDEG